LITENVYVELQKKLSAPDAPKLYFRLLDTVAVKGKTKGVKVFTVKRTLSQTEASAWTAHNQGMLLFYKRSFRQAAEKFKEAYLLLAKDPSGSKDPNAENHFRRCAEYVQNPPPEDWDGVEVMKSK